MLRDFALVVMVMPCGLTPVEGIDFVDWFYFSMYACAHVRPTQTHTQCTVRCLWRMVAYWTSTSASEKNIAIPPEQTVWSTSTGLCWRRGEALIQHTGENSPSEPSEFKKKQHGEAFNLYWLLAGWTHRDRWRVFIANNHHIHSSCRSGHHESTGAVSWMRKRETSSHSTRLPLHTFKKLGVHCFVVWVLCTESRLFFKFWELD